MTTHTRNLVDPDLLRAVLLQNEHRFDESGELLGRVLVRTPQNPQALLLNTAILRLQGRYADAEACARRLAEVQPGLVADACIADLRSLQGDRDAFAALRLTLLRLHTPHEALFDTDEAEVDRAGVGGWLHALLAEMADRIGENRAAETHFRQSLEFGGGTLVLVAFANWLIEQRRADEALGLLKSAGAECIDAPDAMRVAYAIAHKRVHLDDAESSVEQGLVAPLRERFTHAGRSDALPQGREQVSFELEVEEDAERACEHALANWSLQKEPADARLLARAAIAAGRSDAIEAIESHVAVSGLSDYRLGALLARARRLGLQPTTYAC